MFLAQEPASKFYVFWKCLPNEISWPALSVYSVCHNRQSLGSNNSSGSCRFNLWQMTPVVYTQWIRDVIAVQSERSVSVLWSPVLGTIVSHVILVRITITCFSKKSVLIIFVLSPLGVTSERFSQSYPSKKSVQISCFHHPVYTSRPS
jgi:hypothetical protein